MTKADELRKIASDVDNMAEALREIIARDTTLAPTPRGLRSSRGPLGEIAATALRAAGYEVDHG